MNFEKNDFIRNILPGYIYFLVILSFYLINGQLDRLLAELHIIDKDGKSTEFASLLGLLISGYPIGFILSNIYRFFHIRFGEHANMESTEASMLVEQFNNDQILERIRNTPDDIFISNKNLGRAYSWFLELFLIEHSNKHVHNRIQNIMTWVHALGGAITAIFAAFLTLIIIGIPVLLTYFKTPDLCEFLQNFCLTFIWGSIIVMFFYVREDTKCIFHVLWRHFISSNQSKLREFLEEGNK